MMTHRIDTAVDEANPWPFRLAVALAVATFPLIWMGGLVTSYDAGMAVPDWPTTFGYNMFLYPWQSWWFGPWDLFVEHGHRLLGALAGLLAMGLVAVSCRAGTPRRVTLAACLLLVLVVAQGVLGGLRVRMNSRVLAQVHGIVGPLFFAAVVSFAFWSRHGYARSRPDRSRRESSQASILMLFVGLLVQFTLGSQIRHVDGLMSGDLFRWSALFHVGMALVLVAISGRLVWQTRQQQGPTPRLARFGLLLFVGQIVLGGMTWLQRYGWPQELYPNSPLPGWVVESEGMWQSVSATAHVAVGSLILAVHATLLVCCGGIPAWTGWSTGREAIA